MIAEYAGLSFYEIINLNICEYMQLRRDAYVYSLNRTEEGRKYLKNAKRMEQTEPERDKLREKYGKKGGR